MRRELAGCDRAIYLNPKDAVAYYQRAVLKLDKLDNVQGALADYDRAIALDLKYIDRPVTILISSIERYFSRRT